MGCPQARKIQSNPSQVFLVTAGDRDEEKLRDDLGIHPANLEEVRLLADTLPAHASQWQSTRAVAIQ
jgi:hypothetical protein